MKCLPLVDIGPLAGTRHGIFDMPLLQAAWKVMENGMSNIGVQTTYMPKLTG